MRLPALLLSSLLLLTRAQQAPQILPSPPSTLLPPFTTTLPLNLTTSAPATCRWDHADVPFPSMANLFAGANTTAHATTLTGLSGTVAVTLIYVQCDAFAASSPPLVLGFRSLPDSDGAPFPRLGNLWGSDNFLNHPEGLAYAASRSSLWLGAGWTAEQLAALRGFNPHTISLTSINACETNSEDLPDDFYLTNITRPNATKGRLQSWPGAWRLDLTNPAVQAYQAALMYCLVVYGGSGYGPNPSCGGNASSPPPLIFDGLFVDNVFLDDGAAVNSRDIFGNPFIPVDRATGQPMTDFNGKWKLGMAAELDQFRASMPYAILDGHAMDITDSVVSSLFNAISLGFIAPQAVEGYVSFASALGTYTAWMTQTAHTPRVTMMESAVRLQFGYGYGFNGDLQTLISSNCSNSHSVPGAPMPGIGNACDPPGPERPGYILPQAFLFARSEYQYMRFGLGLTLLSDGFFAHEIGDSWHGQDFDYDELHFNLGLAVGNATQADVVTPPDPPPLPNPIPLTEDWGLYVRSPDVSNASWALDAAVVPYAGANASARVDIDNTASAMDGIDLSQLVADFQVGGGYLLSFYAKATRDATPVHLNSRKNGGDWHNFGLDVQLAVSSAWAQYNVTFVSTSDGTQGRLSWFLGSAAPNTSVWVNSPTLVGYSVQPPVLTREFDCGVVVVNGDTEPHTVQVGGAGGMQLARLSGQQAPLWQYIVDDANNASFSVGSGQWAVGDFDSGYDAVNAPTSEQVRPANGFYHHFAKGAHASTPAPASSSSSATFALGIPASGAYNVALWWPAAVPARTGWAQAMEVTVATEGGGAPVSVTVDLTTQGGDLFFPVATGVQLGPNSTLTVSCPAGGGTCIADAVLVESVARWNDGSPVSLVTLQGMDAIVLQKTSGAPSSCAAAA
jgi:hypothetical protein